MAMPEDALALIQEFTELVPGVPATDEIFNEILEYFWEQKGGVLKRLDNDLLIQISCSKGYTRKRDGTEELLYHEVSVCLSKLLEPPHYVPRTPLYCGTVRRKDDLQGFMEKMMECRRVLQMVRAGGLCSCNRRLKMEGARLCAQCACEEFLQ